MYWWTPRPQADINTRGIEPPVGALGKSVLQNSSHLRTRSSRRLLGPCQECNSARALTWVTCHKIEGGSAFTVEGIRTILTIWSCRLLLCRPYYAFDVASDLFLRRMRSSQRFKPPQRPTSILWQISSCALLLVESSTVIFRHRLLQIVFVVIQVPYLRF